ncbi:flippase [Allomuricauda sp.]|uniref:flippase n=1 Tax=Flagellimonas alginolytica TaxID=3177515 RepID=UPI0025D7920A|nr:flippase [Allomuricauda sp.]
MANQFNTDKREIIEKGIKVFLIRVLGYGFGFLFTWIIANKYGAKIQGIFSISFLFLSIGAMIAKLGIETALVKWIANSTSTLERKSIYFRALGLVVISSLLIATLLFFLAPTISIMYNKPDIKESLRLAAFAIPFLSILDVSGSYFKGMRSINIYGFYFHLIKFLLPLLIILIFYFSSIMIFEAPIMSYLIGLLAASIIIWMHITYQFKGLVSKPLKNSLTKTGMLLESYPMMISSAIVMIMGWSDVFILGFYVKEDTIGIYSTAIKIATTVSFIYNAVATIATPKIASFFHNGYKEKLIETVSFSARIMFLCGFPIFLIIFLFPEFVLNLFGGEYVSGKIVLRILLLAQLMNVVTGPVGPMFQMTGRQKLLQNLIALALLLNILLSIVLVRYFGAEGVAFGSALGMIFWNILGAWYIWRNDRIRTWPTIRNE